MMSIIPAQFNLAYCHDCKEFDFTINVHKGNMLIEQTIQFEIGKHLAHWKHYKCVDAFQKWMAYE